MLFGQGICERVSHGVSVMHTLQETFFWYLYIVSTDKMVRFSGKASQSYSKNLLK